MTEHVKIAIIGGGVVGCSVLYHLSRLGESNALLLEKNELTSGSTWHAAGNVTFFGHYPSLTRLYVESLTSYLDAGRESGMDVYFHETGSLRLATTPDELQAYRKLEPIYRQLNVEYQVIGGAEIQSIHPLLNINGVLGAAYTPGDGHVDAASATQALAKAAMLRGAEVRCHSKVNSIEQTADGSWRIVVNETVIIAELVVIANSFWARAMLQKIGINIPVFALEHQEIITDHLPEVAELGHELPTVRDPVAPANYRQEGTGLLCGVYESNPKPWAVDGIPETYRGELFPVDLERIEKHLEKVAERFPAFGSAGIKQVINGPISYTPDGLPLLGEFAEQRGLWLATGFCVGIGTGGGAGAYLSHWMIDGEVPYTLNEIRCTRFNRDLTTTNAVNASRQTYAMGYGLPPEN